MGGKSFKMFKTERLALMLLALVLVALAVVMAVKSGSSRQQPIVVTDTVYIAKDTVDTDPKKKKQRARTDSLRKKSRKQRTDSLKTRKAKTPRSKKTTVPPPRRDHLNEPVERY